jgi:hypothetical protein
MAMVDADLDEKARNARQYRKSLDWSEQVALSHKRIKICCCNILASHFLAVFLISEKRQEYWWQEYVDLREQDSKQFVEREHLTRSRTGTE